MSSLPVRFFGMISNKFTPGTEEVWEMKDYFETERKDAKMTVKEFYDSIGEKYDEVFERIGNEAWILKYLKKFACDECFASLKFAVPAKDWGEGFKMSHSLKGLAMNLGLSKLSSVSSSLCEEMRNGAPKGDLSEKLKAVENEYKRIMNAISLLDD